MGRRSELRSGKSLSDILAGSLYTCDGHVLSKKDSQRVGDAYYLWLLAFKDVAHCYGCERNFSEANLRRYVDRLQQLDVTVVSDFCDSLLAGLRTVSPYEGCWKKGVVKAHLFPVHCDPILREMFSWLVNRFIDSPTGPIFRDINVLCQFWKRLTLHDVDWVEREELEKYFRFELHLSGQSYPAELVSCLREQITTWFQGFSLSELKPSHGNGATAEVPRRAGVARKWEVAVPTTSTLILATTFGAGLHPLENFSTGVRDNPVARYQLVPKGIRKKRGICMEPTIHQFYQHAIACQMDEWFDQHQEMRIDLHDQSRSQRLALNAGHVGRYSTIDLSSASDSVTVSLVKEVFRDVPQLLQAFLATRSSRVLLPGPLTINIEKFAPMGSALCFPVECTIFAGIAALACKRAGRPGAFRVYGDDIVIASEAFNDCVDILTQLHFEVNLEKSFGPYSSFTEACGLESFLGYDVTPVRLPRRYDVTRIVANDAQSLSCLVEMCNEMWKYGLYSVRKHLIHLALSVYREVFFSVNPEEGIFHPDPCNDHLRRRYNKDLQCVEYRHLVPVSKQSAGDTVVNYCTWLEQASERRPFEVIRPQDVLRPKSGSSQSRLRRTWTPCS